jgi:gamma-glutamylcyclotransferase (GGCT)/AIG2-like uncharacterized protein YtfP
VSDAGATVDVFVYGTLVPGGGSYDVVRPWVRGHRSAAVRGHLYDTGRGYPGATFRDAGEDAEVHGVVLTLAEPHAALARLDTFEGHEYERVEVQTSDGAAVMTYEWCLPTTQLRAVTGGRWVSPKFSA